MEYVVIKIGGSMISPPKDHVHEGLLCKYANVLLRIFSGNEIDKRLILIVGGGNTSRVYRDLAVKCGEDCDEDKHRIGIAATWLNAELMRALLSSVSYHRPLGVGVYAKDKEQGEKWVAHDFESWLAGDRPILLGGGFITGASTDMNAFLLASKLGLSKIYKLTNVDHVYSKDPSLPGAQPLSRLSWDQYFDMFDVKKGTSLHAPGAHLPVDLYASELARDKQITCVFASGEDPEIISRIFEEKPITGTIIHP